MSAAPASPIANGTAEVTPLAPRHPYPIATPLAALPADFFKASVRGGVLWDLDGTLVESKEIWQHLLNDCSKALGYGELPYEVWEPTFGQSMATNRDMFFPRHSQDAVDQYCYDNYGRYVAQYLHVLPGAEAALEAAQAAVGGDAGRMAICTNCPLPITKQIVLNCPILARFFTPERTICVGNPLTLRPDEVSASAELQRLHLSSAETARLQRGAAIEEYELKAKPCGDLIHAAAARLGLRAEHCLFVGDSKYDMMAATTAGCVAVGIGPKGQGGHFHVADVGELAERLREGTAAAATPARAVL